MQPVNCQPGTGNRIESGAGTAQALAMTRLPRLGPKWWPRGGLGCSPCGEGEGTPAGGVCFPAGRHVTYLHLAAYPHVGEAPCCGTIGIVDETVQLESGSSLLAPMSEIAGRLAPKWALTCLNAPMAVVAF